MIERISKKIAGSRIAMMPPEELAADVQKMKDAINKCSSGMDEAIKLNRPQMIREAFEELFQVWLDVEPGLY